MDRFEYRDGRLHCEALPVSRLASQFGTPLYLYSQDTLLTHFERLRSAFGALDPLVCYSIKSCQNTHLLRLLAERGSGFDVVSGGELHRALHVGVDPLKIVFAGVGKSDTEIREALEAGVGLLNVESESEMEVLAGIAAERGVVVRAALRVNPDVDPHTHRYTTTGKKETKFGVDFDRALDVFRAFRGRASLDLCGLHVHIGSPVNDLSAYRAGIEKALAFLDRLRAEGFRLHRIDIGGGYGAHYEGREAPLHSEYADAIVPLLKGRGLQVILEPGRSIAANAGILVARVLHVKHSGEKVFLVVDASMNELIRPALYGAYHFIWPVEAGAFVPAARTCQQTFDGLQKCDVVGPICESADFLAQGRDLPPMRRGDLVAVFSAGAYAMTMASQYNSRPRAAEVLVSEATCRLIRRRETYADLIAPELLDE